MKSSLFVLIALLTLVAQSNPSNAKCSHVDGKWVGYEACLAEYKKCEKGGDKNLNKCFAAFFAPGQVCEGCPNQHSRFWFTQ